jgi:hypothetical protein
MQIQIRPSRPDDGDRVVEIWRGAVDATHDFLVPADRTAIDALVCNFLPAAPLWLAVNAHDRPVGFMLLEQGHIQALFVDPRHRGAGSVGYWCRMGWRSIPLRRLTSTSRTGRPWSSTGIWVSGRPGGRLSMNTADLTRCSI